LLSFVSAQPAAATTSLLCFLRSTQSVWKNFQASENFEGRIFVVQASTLD